MPLPVLTRLLRTFRPYPRYCFIFSPLSNIRYRLFTAIEDTLWLVRLTQPVFTPPSFPRPVTGFLRKVLGNFTYLTSQTKLRQQVRSYYKSGGRLNTSFRRQYLAIVRSPGFRDQPGPKLREQWIGDKNMGGVLFPLSVLATSIRPFTNQETLT